MSPLKTDERQKLKEKTIAGIHWRFLTTVLQAVLTFSVGVLLARLLPPKDFGLLGMAVIFTGLADLFATVGMGPALIQRNEIDENTISSAFLISIISSMLLTVFFFFTAPFISDFFNEPQVTNILRVLSLLFILNGFSAISRALLARELRFKLLFYQEIASFVLGFGLLAVILALSGFGVWSLVGGTFLRTMISCAILLYFSPPPSLKLSFNKKNLYDILKFGTGVSINDFLWYISGNIDYFFISRYLSPTALGLYTRAFEIIKQPQTRISNVLSSVLFPTYSRIQENRKMMGRIYLKGLDIVSILTFPLLTGVAISSKYFIMGIYGNNWSGAINVLQILCFVGILKSISHLAGAITHATGNIFSEVRRQAIHTLTLVLLSSFFVRYGIEGVALAVVLSSITFYLLMAQCVIKILSIPWSSFFTSQRTGFSLALIVGVVDYVFIYFLQNSRVEIPHLVVLFVLFILSFFSFSCGIIFLPKPLNSDVIPWLCMRYKMFIPDFLYNMLLRNVSF